MAIIRRRRLKRINKIVPRDSYGKKYAESNPVLDKEDIKVQLSKPVETSVHAKPTNPTHIQIINGVVCSTGRYSRLHEDYDDT